MKHSGNRMGITLGIAIMAFFTLLSSCKQAANTKTDLATVDTSKIEVSKSETTRLKKRKQIEEEEQIDSLRRHTVLKNALKIATQHIGKEKFYDKYDTFADSIPMNVEISMDFHFTKTSSHLIIRRIEAGFVYINIYSKRDNKFENVISHQQWTMEYINDTIRDINGDGLNDFVVNWYGKNGCCLKAFSNVFLLRSDKKLFSKNIEFINPTFSPSEKLIRGICYGHPGETEMYKYKWHGENLDTLEYISYEKNREGMKTGKVLVSSKFNVLKILDAVPAEYKKIEGYDWFTGKIP